MTHLFRQVPDKPLIAPSILSADFARMGEECANLLNTASGGSGGSAGADLLHLDVMDGHFVPNLTMGPDLCRCLRQALPNVFLDVHLMVTDPGKFVEPFAKAGANNLTFHVETGSPKELIALGERVRGLGATAGLAINPPTPVEKVLDLVSHFDLLLVMSVNPGFSGQKFMGDVLSKTREIRKRAGSKLHIQMDGGIGPDNIRQVLDAGCNVVVAASAIFGLPPAKRLERIAQLRQPLI